MTYLKSQSVKKHISQDVPSVPPWDLFRFVIIIMQKNIFFSYGRRNDFKGKEKFTLPVRFEDMF